MSFRLVDTGWGTIFKKALLEDHSTVRIVCPFIKRAAAELILVNGRPDRLRIVTRYNLADFACGVSDVSALRLLLNSGAEIRGVRNLHAKVYLLGESRVVVTSANLTQAALFRNHEFGFVAEDANVVRPCSEYFEVLWQRAGDNLATEQLDGWEMQVDAHLARGAPPTITPLLGDEGVDIRIPAPPAAIAAFSDSTPQTFVKFFGLATDNRASRSYPVLDEVKRAGCHWACTYPLGKRPRSVVDGALMFMARLVKEPADIIVFGRAVGRKHEPERDDASAADITRRDWKARWPHYIRVHNAEFVAGTIENGVSLNELMNLHAQESFAATSRNAAAGSGNTNPRRAYMRQPAVELTQVSSSWLTDQLERRFARYGKVPPATLARLDWPSGSRRQSH